MLVIKAPADTSKPPILHYIGHAGGNINDKVVMHMLEHARICTKGLSCNIAAYLRFYTV